MLKKCKQHKMFTRGETIIHSYYRCLSFFLVHKVLLKTSITPNQITLFRTVLMLFSFSLFLPMNGSFFLGFVLFQISELLDSTDGDLARAKGMQSKFGVWLEIFFDSILTPVWGGMGLLFAYISYTLDHQMIYFILWGLIGFSTNLEKSFLIHFEERREFENKSHDDVYYGFVGRTFPEKIKHFIVLSKSWENQWFLVGGLIYLFFGINLFLATWIWLLALNQIPWIRVAFRAYKRARYDHD